MASPLFLFLLLLFLLLLLLCFFFFPSSSLPLPPPPPLRLLGGRLHGFWEIGKHLAQNTTLRKLYLTNDIETDPEFLIGPYGMQAFCDCFDDRYKWALSELDISGHLIGDVGCTHLANLLYRNASMQRNLVFLAVKNQVR